MMETFGVLYVGSTHCQALQLLYVLLDWYNKKKSNRSSLGVKKKCQARKMIVT